VTRGSKVKRGHLLGTVGDTGYVTTPQLHFEIRRDRKPVDPMTKLPAR
jgi:murein DD-endopeptidase MepM/ murein hydrolase activator NlpD